jgi:phytanoyl-CoA hydroxylase
MNFKNFKGRGWFFTENGYVIIEDFLNKEEREHWRGSITEAIQERKGRRCLEKLSI